jgi:hypothetical protein
MAALLAQQHHQSHSGGASLLPAAYFPKPAPMHLTHGNASATLLTNVTAKKAHQDNRDILLGHAGGGGGGIAASPRAPNARAVGETASPSGSPHGSPLTGGGGGGSRMHSRQPSAAVVDDLIGSLGLVGAGNSGSTLAPSPGRAGSSARMRATSASRVRVIAQ